MWNVARIFAFGGVVVLLVALAPADVVAQKKKNAKNNAPQYPQATETDYASLQSHSQKNLTGKIVTFDEKSVSLRVEYTTLQPNPNYKPPVLNRNARGYNSQAAQQHNLYRKYQDLQNQMARAATARTPQQEMQAQMRIRQDMMQIQNQLMQQQMRMAGTIARANSNPNNQPYKQVTKTMDFTFDLEDKVVYRKMFLPYEFDDEGNPKKYTTAEKLALRGEDHTKPGYIAKAEEVQVGDEARISLKFPPKKKAKADDDAPTPDHPTITMIVLTKDSPANSSPGQNSAPKKKN
jgi:hypothetical protein